MRLALPNEIVLVVSDCSKVDDGPDVMLRSVESAALVTVVERLENTSELTVCLLDASEIIEDFVSEIDEVTLVKDDITEKVDETLEEEKSNSDVKTESIWSVSSNVLAIERSVVSESITTDDEI